QGRCCCDDFWIAVAGGDWPGFSADRIAPYELHARVAAVLGWLGLDREALRGMVSAGLAQLLDGELGAAHRSAFRWAAWAICACSSVAGSSCCCSACGCGCIVSPCRATSFSSALRCLTSSNRSPWMRCRPTPTNQA